MSGNGSSDSSSQRLMLHILISRLLNMPSDLESLVLGARLKILEIF